MMEQKNDSSVETFSWLQKHALKFGMNGDAVHIIETPDEFYQTLIDKASSSTRRIVLASLYLGTGEQEEKFVQTIYDTAEECQRNNKPLDVKILLECSRGSRGRSISSRTMLLPLLNKFKSDVSVALYHTPDLYGFWKKVLPERWNEIVSLAHIKVYIFDDDIIISGANLSESYFTNRQDRYVLLKQVPAISDFYHKLINAISSMSFQLQPNDTVELHKSNHLHPYLHKDKGVSFKRELAQRVKSVMGNSNNQDFLEQTSTNTTMIQNDELKIDNSIESNSVIDTWVYPLVQMGPYGIRNDSQATEEFFKKSPSMSQVFLASGYFNLTDHYIDVITNKSKAKYEILTASPKANGFFGGKGISGSVPTAYTHIAKTFYGNLCQKCQQNRIGIHEFSRTGWTFHAKGLWYYFPGQSLPSLTFVGSPNFGYRSVYRDVESQLVICTTNTNLRESLHKEQMSLFGRATKVTDKTFSMPCRKVPLWASQVTRIIRTFF